MHKIQLHKNDKIHVSSQLVSDFLGAQWNISLLCSYFFSAPPHKLLNSKLKHSKAVVHPIHPCLPHFHVFPSTITNHSCLLCLLTYGCNPALFSVMSPPPVLGSGVISWGSFNSEHHRATRLLPPSHLPHASLTLPWSLRTIMANTIPYINCVPKCSWHSSWTAWPSNMGSTSFPKTSVRNYHSTLHTIPKECIPKLFIHSLVFSLRGWVGRNQSPVMWPVWLWHTASWASSWG